MFYCLCIVCLCIVCSTAFMAKIVCPFLAAPQAEKESDMFVWLDKLKRSADIAEAYEGAKGGKQKVASRRAETFDEQLPADRCGRHFFQERCLPIQMREH